MVTVSLCWAQAPKLKALAKTATIMIAFKNFNLSRLLSQQVAPVCLGKELQGSNAFLNFFGRIKMAHLSTCKVQSRASLKLTSFYSSITTGAPSSTRSNNSITSALRIRTHPWLAGLPILSSCLVP